MFFFTMNPNLKYFFSVLYKESKSKKNIFFSFFRGLAGVSEFFHYESISFCVGVGGRGWGVEARLSNFFLQSIQI